MTKDDHEKNLQFFKENNPDLFNNPEKMKESMEELRQDYDKEKDPLAKNIYAQGYNIFAHALQEELILETEIIPSEVREHFQKTDEKNFDLNAYLPELLTKMITPKKHSLFIIVDDKPEYVKGLIQILKAWPSIDVRYFPVSKKQDFPIIIKSITSYKRPIILLDEAIDEIRGTDIAETLKEKGFEGLIASITGGSCPSFTDLHFRQKDGVPKNKYSTDMFVDFVNHLIKKMEEEQ